MDVMSASDDGNGGIDSSIDGVVFNPYSCLHQFIASERYFLAIYCSYVVDLPSFADYSVFFIIGIEKARKSICHNISVICYTSWMYVMKKWSGNDVRFIALKMVGQKKASLYNVRIIRTILSLLLVHIE